LNGFIKVLGDVGEYFLQVRIDHEKAETIELRDPDNICGHKQIYEHFKWCRTSFVKNKYVKGHKDHLQEIANKAFSLLWKFNTQEYAS